jgi:hypothetical protein
MNRCSWKGPIQKKHLKYLKTLLWDFVGHSSRKVGEMGNRTAFLFKLHMYKITTITKAIILSKMIE